MMVREGYQVFSSKIDISQKKHLGFMFDLLLLNLRLST